MKREPEVFHLNPNREKSILVDAILSGAQLAEILGVSEESLPRLVRDRRIPQPVEWRWARGPRWLHWEVENWIYNGCPPLKQAEEEKGDSGK